MYSYLIFYNSFTNKKQWVFTVRERGIGSIAYHCTFNLLDPHDLSLVNLRKVETEIADKYHFDVVVITNIIFRGKV